jgi:hypothetical protein
MKFKFVNTRFATMQFPKITLPKYSRFAILSSLSVASYVLYVKYFQCKMELVYLPSDLSEEIISSISFFRQPTYRKSLLFPLRFTEIIYGNVWDQREFVEYERETIECQDGEHLAVGELIRLDRH